VSSLTISSRTFNSQRDSSSSSSNSRGASSKIMASCAAWCCLMSAPAVLLCPGGLPAVAWALKYWPDRCLTTARLQACSLLVREC